MELLDIVRAQKNEHILKNLLKFLMGLIWWGALTVCGRLLIQGGESVAEIIQFIFQFQHLAYVLSVTAIWIVCKMIHRMGTSIGEQYFLRVYSNMSEAVKQKLLYGFQEQNSKISGICEADGHLLFCDISFYNTPQIVEIKDIVWVYYKKGMYSEYAEMEKNTFTSTEGTYLLDFYTRDKSLHRAAVCGSIWEIYLWFREKCPDAIWGYGKFQKIKAGEMFKKDAERTVSEKWEETGIAERKRAGRLAIVEECLIIATCLLALFFSVDKILYGVL